jgi:RNA polymerase sigma-70 factor (ECF subfamily)
MMDQETFSNLLLIHSDQLYRLAKSILLDEDASKDCLQDLYIKLWEKREDLKDINNIRAFALKSIRNLCLDKLRRKKDTDILYEELESKDADIHDTVEQKDMMKMIKQLIDKLPELQRSIIRLRDVEGLEIKEIAYITSSNENAVTANLSRARQKIREQLKHFITD